MTKLPPFAGRCRAANLTAHAARRAAQAQYLRRWHQLSPEAEATCRRGAETNIGRMLTAMALVLALALAAAWAQGTSPPKAPAGQPARAAQACY